MKLKTRAQSNGSDENLIPLINIVFLILIFFLVASTIRPFSDRNIELAKSTDVSNSAIVPRILVMSPTGERSVKGRALNEEELSRQIADWAEETDKAVIIAADADVDGAALVDTVSAFTAGGVSDVKLLTRRTR